MSRTPTCFKCGAFVRLLASRIQPCLFRQHQSSRANLRRLLSSTQPGENVRPLDGVKVLDLTRVLAGPFATMILGDLGAEIIKVERPGAGDDTRSWGPPFVGDESAYFLSVNRNKKVHTSVAVNLKDPRGAKIILEDGDPVRPGVAMTDLATGLYTHGAIMAALLQRHKTGRGVHIDCNLLSTQVACLTHIAANYLNAGKEARRWGTAHESIVPYQGFRTKDGYLVVAAGNDKQFVKVCKVLGLNHLSEEPNYKSNTLRVQHRQELLHILSQRFLEEVTGEWLRRFEGTGVPCGPINNIQQVFSEPQVANNGLILEMNHPMAGRIAVPGPAVRFSTFESREPMPPPMIGQHTVQVLRDSLSYSDDVINQLLASGTVAQNEVH
ncbi:succinate--hydroxymethylglutarate CoA-transferase isoform X4 [Coregonus clupeaformis]|uniref:succinate--hydroxymethylglutarate CoA-transferase isoform X4 n=1 Tax=Coregonus clupeaformis TaxID=59861 RepID=UPI001E1C86A4|nr:succinate--hydroxymethylglutarate CoA-transferase isoform X4 [Coregonus clupeaformis]